MNYQKDESGSCPPESTQHMPRLGVRVLMLGIGLTMTFAAWYFADRQATSFADKSFALTAAQLETAVVDRLAGYEEILLGSAALFTVNTHESRQSWRNYVSRVNARQQFGYFDIGFIRIPDHDDPLWPIEGPLLADIDDADIWPDATEKIYATVVQVSPHSPQDRRVPSNDILTDVLRSGALLEARDTGAIAVSTDSPFISPAGSEGVTLFLPVYRTKSIPLTVQERRQTIYGYVYVPLPSDSLLRGIFQPGESLVDVNIYDGTAGSASTALYKASSGNDDGRVPRHTARSSVTAFDRTWNLQFQSTPFFEQIHDARFPWAVAGGGVLVSILAFVIATILLNRESVLSAANLELARTNAEAEQASRAKSNFLAVMSHEIRTPMNGVIGMVDVLSRSRLDSDQREALHTVQQSALALLSIIDDVLDFSKIEAGRLELLPEPIVLLDLMKEALVSLSGVIQARDVDVTLYMEPQVPDSIIADRTRLRQVLNNLVSNAIKFSSGRPEIRGSVNVRVEVRDTDARKITVVVKDNGIGMTPETAVKVFDPFTQATTATTRRFGGTGLGLTICRRLTELMGGEISVESEPDVGSTFTVTLPVDVADGPERRLLPDLADLDCLVVPGPFATADEIRAYLEPAGVRIQETESLEQAMELARPTPISVIIVQDFSREAVPQFQITLERVLSEAPDVRVLLLTWAKNHLTCGQDQNCWLHDGALLERHGFQMAVAIAAGRASPYQLPEVAPAPAETAASQPMTIADARQRGRLILVAEDDSTNQKVILRQLKVLGYAAQVASNGVEAFDLWREQRFALVLTDLHMPDMDGYELTRAIRREEAAGDNVPIVGLSANALKGEAARAKAVGMDEYLTKPVRLPRLEATLLKWIDGQRAVTDAAGDPGTQANETTAALDASILTELVGNDELVIREVLSAYLLSAEEMVNILPTGDQLRIRSHAHRLKSSSRAIGAFALADCCADLENACSMADAAAIARHSYDFRSLLIGVKDAIESRCGHPEMEAKYG